MSCRRIDFGTDGIGVLLSISPDSTVRLAAGSHASTIVSVPTKPPYTAEPGRTAQADRPAAKPFRMRPRSSKLRALLEDQSGPADDIGKMWVGRVWQRAITQRVAGTQAASPRRVPARLTHVSFKSFFDQCAKRIRCQRAPQQKTLHLIARHGLQLLELGKRFDTFRDHIHLE